MRHDGVYLARLWLSESCLIVCVNILVSSQLPISPFSRGSLPHEKCTETHQQAHPEIAIRDVTVSNKETGPMALALHLFQLYILAAFRDVVSDYLVTPGTCI